MNYNPKSCALCPRSCKADRTKTTGFCGGKDKLKAARAALHFWEEPCISGDKGSGTVFFSGCVLKCCFCQNYPLSAENFGKEITVERLSEIFLELQEKGAHNINLVNPTHFVPWILNALDLIKAELKIPVVYNSGGYETIETIKALRGYVDIFLPDFKYIDSESAKKYSLAPDYMDFALPAIKKMAEISGKPQFDSDGIMKKGTIVRHLVLPSHRSESIKLLGILRESFPQDEIMLSLMSQYTPCYKSFDFSEISRRISTFEYNQVLKKAEELGFKGFMQERSSAKEEYTPPFDLSGL